MYSLDKTAKLNRIVWTEQVNLTASDVTAFYEFGNSVAIIDDIIDIGAEHSDTENGNNSGSAYMFIHHKN